MPRLIVVRDIFRRELDHFELTAGASLGAELMRLFPSGVPCEWRMYADTVNEANRIAPEATKLVPVSDDDQFVMVQQPGAPAVPYLIQFAIGLLLSAVSMLLMPKPKRPHATGSESKESGTTEIAAQSNLLRPGARVPEMLGCVRCYPDLLTNAIEVWNYRTQTIDEWFVVGVGDYEVIEKKLGETPYEMITGSALPVLSPGTNIPLIECVKISSNVNEVDLDAEDGTTIPPVGGIDFISTTKIMRAPEELAILVGNPLTLGGTANAGFHFALSQDGAEPPWDYHMNGTIVDETNVNPSIKQWVLNLAQGYYPADVNGNDATFTTSFGGAYAVGDAFHLKLNGTSDWYGKISAVTVLSSDMSGTTIRLDFNDMYGAGVVFPTDHAAGIYLENWHPPPATFMASAEDAVVTPLTASTDTYPTDWVGVPMADPDEVWVDISFPRGLSHFHSSSRLSYDCTVDIRFRRGLSGTPVTQSKTYSYATAVPIRFTEKFIVSTLGLTGTGQIMVQLQRSTRVDPDTSTDTYISECRWHSLRAMKKLINQSFPGVTTAHLTIENSRSASSLGDYAVNFKVTRKLPTWTGSGSVMTTTTAGSRKWADNFVSRCHAVDGANLPYDKIDLAGIYALQAQLDEMDVLSGRPAHTGMQGEISLTLDQQQDMDAELAEIADVVRAYVYRTGQRIFVTRDQNTNSTIALFNGRTKSNDGESTAVRMKSGDENDAVAVQWVDEGNGFKQRELQYPAGTKTNVLRVSVKCANWQQAWRRARYEWAKLLYRREQITVGVTEDGRICRPGDVVNITDDIANLALIAGEVQHVSGSVLTLDKAVDFSVPGTYSIVLRDVHGMLVDSIPITAVSGSPFKVQLSRSTGITIKPKDLSLGTLYAFHRDTDASVRQWLLTAVVAGGPFVQLTGFNYTNRVYADDATTIDPKPPIG